MYKFLVLPVIFSFSMNAMLIEPSAIRSPERLGKFQLYRDDRGFHVKQNEVSIAVKNHNLDKILRALNPEQLQRFQEVGGYIAVEQMSDGDFTLKADGRLNGGGKALGAVLYFVTKVACHAALSISAGFAAKQISKQVHGSTAAQGAAGKVAGKAAEKAIDLGINLVTEADLPRNAMKTAAKVAGQEENIAFATGAAIGVSGGPATALNWIENFAQFMKRLGEAVPGKF